MIRELRVITDIQGVLGDLGANCLAKIPVGPNNCPHVEGGHPAVSLLSRAAQGAGRDNSLYRAGGQVDVQQ